MGSVEAKAVGRPPKEIDPVLAQRAEVRAWVDVQSTIRKQVATILASFQKDINSPGVLNRQGMLEILTGLKDVLGAASRTIESGMRVINSAELPPPAEDPDQVMADLLK